MKDNEISQEVLDRFASRTATSDERRRVVRHLIEGCSRCNLYLKQWLPLCQDQSLIEIADDLDQRYDAVFDRALTRALSSAQTGVQGLISPAKKLLAELEAHPPKRQETLVLNLPRYWTTDLCHLLIDCSHQARFSDIALMRHQAKLALIVAQHLAGRAEECLVSDCLSRSWIAVGNSLRVSGDLNAAGMAFADAGAHLATGTGDSTLRARFLSQLASLRFDQRRFDESLALLRETGEIWRSLHNSREVTLALIQQAMATGEGGKPRAAVHLLVEAGRLVDSAADPKLALIILHNIIKFQVYGGQSELALRLFVEARTLYRQERDPLIRVKELWLEGQILSAQGLLEPAVRLLAAAREGFLSQGNLYEAAIVSLDLAAVFAKLGRLPEVRTLARETLQEMEVQGVQREAIAALILLMQAGTAETALTLIRRIASAIRAPRVGVS